MTGLRLKTAVWMVIVALASLPAMAETPEEWIVLGTRIHGGFGAFIPVGIRIGLDALQRLNANQREVTVLYYDSDKAPCACIADGVAICDHCQRGTKDITDRTRQGSFWNNRGHYYPKQTGKAVQYTVGDDLLPKIVDWNRSLDSRGRYEAVMAADKLFQAMPVN